MGEINTVEWFNCIVNILAVSVAIFMIYLKCFNPNAAKQDPKRKAEAVSRAAKDTPLNVPSYYDYASYRPEVEKANANLYFRKAKEYTPEYRNDGYYGLGVSGWGPSNDQGMGNSWYPSGQYSSYGNNSQYVSSETVPSYTQYGKGMVSNSDQNINHYGATPVEYNTGYYYQGTGNSFNDHPVSRSAINTDAHHCCSCKGCWDGNGYHQYQASSEGWASCDGYYGGRASRSNNGNLLVIRDYQ